MILLANISAGESGGSKESLLHSAQRCVRNNELECLESILAKRNSTEGLSQANLETLLSEAAFHGHHALVELFLRAGVAPTARSRAGATVLHNAAEGGHAEIVSLLLEAGADANSEYNSTQNDYRTEHWSPLHAAAQKGSASCVEVLLRHGADPNREAYSSRPERAYKEDGRVGRTIETRQTPLDLAMAADEPVRRLLVRAGAKHGPTYAEAQRLNSKGYSFYKKGRLRKAAEMFEKATSLGVTHYTAQFNLACTYARLAVPKKGRPCDGQWFHRSLLALSTAIEMNRGRTLEKAEADADFDGIRRYPGFIELVKGTTFEDAEDVTPYLVGKIFMTSCPGSAYCAVRTLAIGPDGSWHETTHANENELNGCFHGDACPEGLSIEYAERSGNWTLEGRTLVLRAQETVERLEVKHPGQIGDLFWPNPNDASGESDVEAEASCYAAGLAYHAGP